MHDDAFFAAKAREMASWPGTKSLYLEDAAGVLTPERAATLLPAIRAATGDIPLELHCHATTGLAQHNYIEGMKAGFTWLHTATRPLANGVSLPSTEGMVTVVEALGHTHSLDTARFAPVAANFARAAQAAGRPLGEVAEYDPRVYDHQVPGGMMGTLRNQLATHGMADRLPQVLEEIPLVRRELGEPIMATPFSQFVGIQAVLNVVTGDRYSMVPDEVVHYVLQHYGPLAAPIAPDVADRVLSGPRAQQLAGWERPNPSIAEVRKRYSPGMSDEELLLRFMTSDEEVDRMQAAGPLRTDPRWAASSIVGELEDLIADRTNLTSISVSRPGLQVRLNRRR